MIEKKKTSAKKKVLSTKKTEPIKKNWRYRLRQKWHNLCQRRQNYLRRRPHRSFRLTRRRDYKRSLKMPGYFALTKELLLLLRRNKRIFLGLILIYVLLAVVISGLMAQDTYQQMVDAVSEAKDEGLMGGVAATLSLFWGVFSNQLSSGSSVDASAAIISSMMTLFMWLSTVWLLRAIMAGRRPKVRDGLYSSGGPILALLILVIVLLLQLLPAAIAIITYGAAGSSGILDQTAMLMLFGGGAILLVVLSVYWATSTFFAMIIVSLPNMYPMEAIRLAGDIVVGRRTRILLRLAWLLLLLLLMWVVLLIPIILLDGALKSALPDLEWLPLVPFSALFLAAASIILSASYIYLFYRKVVDDDAKPA